MKRENSVWLNILFFLLGSLVCYLLCQIQYLQIDTKVNVSTSLISAMTAVIALFLAITIKRTQTKSSNLHGYLQPKLDLIWRDFLTLSHKLSLNDQVEVKELSKSIKEIALNLNPLKKMITSFGLKNPCIDNLETKIEALEKFLVDDCQKKNNIIKYADNKSNLRIRLDEIHSLFTDSLKEINKIS